jgi:hypothetical protein
VLRRTREQRTGGSTTNGSTVSGGTRVCVFPTRSGRSACGASGSWAPSLPVVEGDTENATVVKDLLVSLRDRWLDVTRPILA